jgi:hypothetical protein
MILFLTKNNLILRAGYVQGNLLDKNVGVLLKGGWSFGPSNCMPINGDNGDGDLLKT